MRRNLLENGYTELPITGEHAVNVDGFPRLQKDPFDRLLLAQAHTEGITLITADAQLLSEYGGAVLKVQKSFIPPPRARTTRTEGAAPSP